MSEKNHDRISLTAKLVSYYRQFSDIPFSKDAADHVGAERAFQDLVAECDLKSEELLLYAPILEARYKSISAQVLKSDITQVLELASGFSLRGLVMTQNPKMNYVESDLGDLTTEKTALISKIRLQHHLKDYGNYQIASANALELEQLREAVRFFKPHQALAVVNEGLIQYLSHEEMKVLAKNVRELLLEFGGVWITPDFFIKTDSQNVSEKRKKFRQAVSGVTETEMYASAFESYDQMDVFFEESGFVRQRLNQVKEAGELVSMKTLGLSPEVVEKLKSGLNLWVLHPR
ncbi:MAG TPA: class I SAM-dependent methyltransferase [bacterium]|nr:class I SAM-dependent methyltransferase [bacterium]